MSTARRLHYSYEEYLGALEMSELRLEYQEGVIYAMAGGTRAQAQLSAAMIGLLHSRLVMKLAAWGVEIAVDEVYEGIALDAA